MNPKSQRETLLLVDDSQINRIILRKLLSDEYDILEAENGEQALKLIRQATVAAILLDLYMPVMDGFQFLRERERKPALENLPVIVLTEGGEVDSEKRALELGANDVLTKPYNPSALRLRVRNLLQLTRAVSERKAVDAVINRVPSGITIFRVESGRLNFTYANDTVYQMSGYTKSEFHARFGSELKGYIYPEDWQLLRQQIFEHSGQSVDYVDVDFRVRRRDGTTHWQHMRAAQVSGGGEGGTYYAVINNIDRIKMAEEELMRQHQELKNANEKLELTVNFSRIGVTEYDIASRTIIIRSRVNPAFLNEQDVYPVEQFVTLPRYPAETSAKLREMFARLERGEEEIELTLPITIEGQSKWHKLVYHTLRDAHGRPKTALGVIWDVTDEVNLKANYEKEKQIHLAQASGALLVLEGDVNTDEILSQQNLLSFGIPLSATLSDLHQVLMELAHPDDREQFSFEAQRNHLLEDISNGHTSRYVESRFRSAKESYRGYRWRSVSYHFILNPTNGHFHAIIFLRDIHAKKVEEQESKQRAQRDAMTGLLNRATFEDFVVKELQTDAEHRISAFLLIDIDDFKHINDGFGHIMGDRVLAFMGKRLRSSFRSSDIVGRLGGDELAVFMTNLPSEQFAAERGDALCQSMAHWRMEENTLEITCSVGISLAPKHGTTFEELYQRADTALYQSKENGKNQCSVFDTKTSKPSFSSWMNKDFIVDALEDRVYVCDTQTYQILYMNRAARIAFQVDRRAQNLKCYQVFQKRSTPCTFCTNRLLNYSEFYSWEQIDPVTNRMVLHRDKLINWDGRTARMEVTTELQEELRGSSADAEITEQARRYQFLLEHTDLMPFEYDPVNDVLTYLWKTPKGEREERRLMGYLARLPDNHAIHPEDLGRYSAALSAAIHQQLTGDIICRADFTGNGRYWECRCQYASIADERGRVCYVAGKIQLLREEQDEIEEDIQTATVLVVDDIESNRAVLCNALREKYQVLEAQDGLEAKLLLKRRRDIRVVMLDLMMPVMDGFTVLEYIRDTPSLRGLTTIVCTAYDEAENQIRALQLGAYDCISKPYNVEIVLQRLHNILQQQTMRRLRERQQYDNLTGIFNREGFYRATRQLIDEHPEMSFTIVYWNIRRFKVLNALFGSATGDQVLRDLANQLSASHPANTTYARTESDNFAICLPSDRLDLNTLRERSQRYLERGGTRFEYTIAYGIYPVTDRSLSINTMCDYARLAMQTAQGGRILPYAVYDDSMGQRMIREQTMISQLHTALEGEQFVVYYQPIYEAHTEQVSSAEALIRWKHPQKGMVPPNDFIPLFEKNGMISELDRYVTHRVCQLQARHRAEGKRVVPISVNLSRVNFYDANLCQELTALVDSYDLPHSDIRFEVTESAYAENESEVQRIVGAMRDNGFLMLMDDFGSGYSSLNILKNIPVDILKVDMRFMEEVETCSRSGSIVSTIIRMAKLLDMKVVAEGVETRAQLDFLREAGCNWIQGYYYSRPLKSEQFEALLNLPEEA